MVMFRMYFSVSWKISHLPKSRYDKELRKGMDDIQEGRVYIAEQVEAEMKKDYGI